MMGVKSLLLRRGLTFRTDVVRVQMPARKRSGRPSNIEIGNGARGERKRAPPFGGALFLAHLLDVGGESLRGLAEQAAYVTKRTARAPIGAKIRDQRTQITMSVVS